MWADGVGVWEGGVGGWAGGVGVREQGRGRVGARVWVVWLRGSLGGGMHSRLPTLHKPWRKGSPHHLHRHRPKHQHL